MATAPVSIFKRLTCVAGSENWCRRVACRVADSLTPERRSWNMSRIRGRDTKPEVLVRSTLHRMGFRFTVNGPLNCKLPGRPDIVLPKHSAVVFVHGCFWHRHARCKYAYTPKTRVSFWEEKFFGNVERDRKNGRALARLGWKVVTVWECELAKSSTFERRLASRITSPRR